MPLAALAPRSAAWLTVGRTIRVNTPPSAPNKPSTATAAANPDGALWRRAHTINGHSTEENSSANMIGSTPTQILLSSHSPAATASPISRNRADHAAVTRKPAAITVLRSTTSPDEGALDRGGGSSARGGITTLGETDMVAGCRGLAESLTMGDTPAASVHAAHRFLRRYRPFRPRPMCSR